MERLYFGVRARRRARRARIKRLAVVAWVVALVAGVPGATVALDWLNAAAGGRDINSASVAVRRPPQDHVQRGTVAKEMKASLHEEKADERAVTGPVYGGSITDTIHAAASEFGLDGGYLLSVASCESGLDPSAYNPAGYHGLFQFDQTTWSAYGYGSIYDPVAQARTAARLLAAGQSSRWPNCA